MFVMQIPMCQFRFKELVRQDQQAVRGCEEWTEQEGMHETDQ